MNGVTTNGSPSCAMQPADAWTTVSVPSLSRSNSKGKLRKQRWNVGISALKAGSSRPWLWRSSCQVVCKAHPRGAVGGCALLLLFLLLVVAALLGSLPGTGSIAPAGSHLAKPGALLTPILSTGRDHVLLYAFSYTDPEFLHNLEYFVQEAVEGDTLADYIIIVQQGPTLKVGLLHTKCCDT